MKTAAMLFLACATLTFALTAHAPAANAQARTKPGYLTDEEWALSQSSEYIVVNTKPQTAITQFNLQTWPIACPAVPAAPQPPTSVNGYQCTAGDAGKSVGLRDITVTGLVLIIDPTAPPWSVLSGQRYITNITVEADKVVILGAVRLPSTNLTINAQTVIFDTDGSFDLTPVSYAGHAVFTQNMTKATDGGDGVPGPAAAITASRVQVLGDGQKPRLIADGGAGQQAGDGYGQTIDQFNSSNALNSGNMPPIPSSSVPAPFAATAPGVVFSASHCGPNGHNGGGVGPHQHQYWVPETIYAEGSDRWPGSAADPNSNFNGIAGGVPGAGGQGGQITLTLVQPLDPNTTIGRVNGGGPGAADYDRYGFKAGQPNPAYHIVWSGRCTGPGVGESPGEVQHAQIDGTMAASPKTPNHVGPSGNVSISVAPTFHYSFSPIYYNFKLFYIRDLYYNKRFGETVAAINDVDIKLTSEPPAFQSSADIAPIAAELTKYRQYLISQKDYYGRGLQDAPQFSFQFNYAAYKAQVDDAMDSYLLATFFLQAHVQRQALVSDVQSSLAAIEKELSDSAQQINQAESRISNITAEMASVKANQDLIQHELEDIKQEIQRKATDTVAQRHAKEKELQTVDIALSICQVFPIGQPALGIAATLVKTTVKGPATKDLSGWVNYYKSVSGQVQNLNDPAIVAKTQQNWDAFLANFDTTQLNGKSFTDKVKILQADYARLSEVAKTIGDAEQPLNQPAYPASEVEQEIVIIEGTDPMFQTVAKRLRDLMAQKADLLSDVTTFVGLESKLMSQLSEYIGASARISQGALATSLVDDPVLHQVFTKIARDDQDRILFLYDEVVRSWNYMTLHNYQNPMDIMQLRAKIATLFEGQVPTEPTGRLAYINSQVELLHAFYNSQLDLVKDNLMQMLRNGSPLIRTRVDKNTVVLNQAQLTMLAKTGSVRIPLPLGFFGGTQNVRIQSIEIPNQQYAIGVGPGAVSDYPLIRMIYTLGRRGNFHYQGAKDFYYPKIGNFFTWENTFRSQDGTWVNQPNDLNPDIGGLIAGLLPPDALAGHDLTVFSDHAGLTDLIVTEDRIQGPYQLTKLAVRVNYTFSDASR